VTKRQAKGREREQAVVHAAALVIAERGLRNVRVADIAERAGMSPGHVTYYFPSKNELLMRAIRQSEEEFHDKVEREIALHADPWDRLDRLIELAASDGQGDPGFVLWFEVWSNAGLDPAVARIHDELDGWWRRALADVIRYGCDEGAFQTDDPDGVALLLSGLVDGLSVLVTLGSEGVTRRQLLDTCSGAARAHLAPKGSSRDTATRVGHGRR